MTRSELNILRRLWRSTKQGLWFRPLLWILAVTLLALAAYPLGALLLDLLPLPEVRRETAQALLELLASAMLTVTTVAFSMVMVVITFASGQVSPRSIPGILRDAAIQDALGVFLAGLVFGLLGMLSIEVIGIWHHGPLVTVLLGGVICTLTVVYLVRLIHHVSRRVQVTHILAQQRDLGHASIDRFFGTAPPGKPVPLDTECAEGLGRRPDAGELRLQLDAPVSGYLQVLNLQDVFHFARAHDLFVRVRHTEGDYVGRGWPIFDVLAIRAPDDETLSALRSTAQIGEERTPEGDPLFPLEVLGEIGERALSPGVNDTGTALAALDHVADCLLRWARHADRLPGLADDEGRLRVAVTPPRLATALERTVARILRSGQGNPEVERRALWLLDQLSRSDSIDAMARTAIVGLRRRAAPRNGEDGGGGNS